MKKQWRSVAAMLLAASVLTGCSGSPTRASSSLPPLGTDYADLAFTGDITHTLHTVGDSTCIAGLPGWSEAADITIGSTKYLFHVETYDLHGPWSASPSGSSMTKGQFIGDLTTQSRSEEWGVVQGTLTLAADEKAAWIDLGLTRSRTTPASGVPTNGSYPIDERIQGAITCGVAHPLLVEGSP